MVLCLYKYIVLRGHVYDLKKGGFVDFFSLMNNNVLYLPAIYFNTKYYL